MTRRPNKTFALAALLALSAATAPLAQEKFDCVIDPSFQVKLGSPAAGLLAEVTVDRGDWVAAGQVVARLVSDRERASVALLAARAESTTGIEAQAARVELARKAYERAKQLYDQNIGSREAYEERQAALEVATGDLTEARLNHRLAELELARARIAVAEREIRSPIAGVVTERFLGPGEFLNSDLHVVSIASLDPLFVEAFVTSSSFNEITPGMTATVYPDSTDAEPRQAEVIVVDRVFDATSDTFGVRLSLPNPDNALPAGQRCHVSFQLPG